MKVVDTVGAGDTVNAGILASLRDQGLLTKPSIAALSEEQIRSVLELLRKSCGDHRIARRRKPAVAAGIHSASIPVALERDPQPTTLKSCGTKRGHAHSVFARSTERGLP